MKCRIMLNFIWVITVCQSTGFGVSDTQMVKIGLKKQLVHCCINALINTFFVTSQKSMQNVFNHDYGHLMYMKK